MIFQPYRFSLAVLRLRGFTWFSQHLLPSPAWLNSKKLLVVTAYRIWAHFFWFWNDIAEITFKKKLKDTLTGTFLLLLFFNLLLVILYPDLQKIGPEIWGIWRIKNKHLAKQFCLGVTKIILNLNYINCKHWQRNRQLLLYTF